MRIILDTNVFISGIFWSGPPETILKAWQTKKISLVLSPEILEEYTRIGTELNAKFPNVELTPIFDQLIYHIEMCPGLKLSQQICEDPDDDKFLACALAAKVGTIVSGDKALLNVSPYDRIEILKPRPFVERFLS